MTVNFTTRTWVEGTPDYVTTKCLACNKVIARSVDDLYDQGWDRENPPTIFAVELAVDLAARLHATTHRLDQPTVQYVQPEPF